MDHEGNKFDHLEVSKRDLDRRKFNRLTKNPSLNREFKPAFKAEGPTRTSLTSYQARPFNQQTIQKGQSQDTINIELEQDYFDQQFGQVQHQESEPVSHSPEVLESQQLFSEEIRNQYTPSPEPLLEESATMGQPSVYEVPFLKGRELGKKLQEQEPVDQPQTWSPTKKSADYQPSYRVEKGVADIEAQAKQVGRKNVHKQSTSESSEIDKFTTREALKHLVKSYDDFLVFENEEKEKDYE